MPREVVLGSARALPWALLWVPVYGDGIVLLNVLDWLRAVARGDSLARILNSEMLGVWVGDSGVACVEIYMST